MIIRELSQSIGGRTRLSATIAAFFRITTSSIGTDPPLTIQRIQCTALYCNCDCAVALIKFTLHCNSLSKTLQCNARMGSEQITKVKSRVNWKGRWIQSWSQLVLIVVFGGAVCKEKKAKLGRAGHVHKS